MGTQFLLINGYRAGYGYDGVAMALIAQLHPLAAILVATSLITVSADPVGVFLDHFGYSNGWIRFEIEDWWLKEVRVEPAPPRYIPKEYRLLREKQQETLYYAFYEGPGANYFTYRQYGQHGSYSFLADSDYQILEVSKNQQAYYLEEGKLRTLVFSDGVYMYAVQGTLSQKQLIKVACSVPTQEVS